VEHTYGTRNSAYISNTYTATVLMFQSYGKKLDQVSLFIPHLTLVVTKTEGFTGRIQLLLLVKWDMLMLRWSLNDMLDRLITTNNQSMFIYRTLNRSNNIL